MPQAVASILLDVAGSSKCFDSNLYQGHFLSQQQQLISTLMLELGYHFLMWPLLLPTWSPHCGDFSGLGSITAAEAYSAIQGQVY